MALKCTTDTQCPYSCCSAEKNLCLNPALTGHLRLDCMSRTGPTGTCDINIECNMTPYNYGCCALHRTLNGYVAGCVLCVVCCDFVIDAVCHNVGGCYLVAHTDRIVLPSLHVVLPVHVALNPVVLSVCRGPN